MSRRRVMHLLGIPHQEVGCYALTRAACQVFDRRVPEIAVEVVQSWKDGDDMLPLVPAGLERVEPGDELPGDVCLSGPGRVRDNISAVVERGFILCTIHGGFSCIAELPRRGSFDLWRPPPC